MTSLIERLTQNSPIFGTMLTTTSAEVAETLVLAGFDWLFLDLEHSVMQPHHAQRTIQAVAGRAFCVVRVAENSPSHIKKALDSGCDGIIVPLVNSAADAERAVKAAKYPPAGERSIGIARAQGYGLTFQEYVKEANQRVALILQLEHAQAIRDLEAILSVKGVDAVFVGPYDLSGSMGLLGQVSHPDVVAAVTTVRQRCHECSIPYGTYAADAEQAEKLVRNGVQLVLMSTDLLLMGNAAVQMLAALAKE